MRAVELSRPLWRGPSVSACMDAADGCPSGFDYLRLTLALLILTAHSSKLMNGSVVPAHGLWRIGGALVEFLVPMFFALAGFLVAASADRNASITTFLGLRILRIFPALWVEILAAALVIGPLLTNLPLGDYLHDPKFARYFLNLVADVQYTLPGVFDANPKHDVNGQLWTVPFELFSYLLLVLFITVGFFARPPLFLAVTIGLALGLLVLPHFNHTGGLDFRAGTICFYMGGVAVFLLRDRIPINRSLAALAGVIVLILFVLHLWSLAFLPLAYLTVFLGLLNPARNWLVRSGDYSYGIYLYHWQIQQALWATTAIGKTWLGCLVLSLTITAGVAFTSWHLVEKPALRLRRRLGAAGQPRFALGENAPHG